MTFRLNVIAGPDRGRVFDINKGQTLVVGRGEQSDTKINDPSVSRIHFEISLDEGDAITVKDRGSSSGTIIDGQPVQSSEIKTGTVIQAGDSQLRIDPPVGAEATIAPGFTEQPTRVKPLRELVGEDLGPYKLAEIIGKGNSGMVFKAHDAEKDRTAAIKVLTPQFTSNDEQRQRFVRAMKTMLPVKDLSLIHI